MNYGWNIGASSVLASMHRQDVATNNLANIETVGFKGDSVFTIPRQAARNEDNLFNLPSNALLERLGAGVLLSPSRPSFQQGNLTHTGNPLDVAIQGSGFLSVRAPGNTPGAPRLTRDGRLSLNSQAQLISISTGQPVLDTNDQPITLDRGSDVKIDGDGVVRQNGATVAQLRISEVANPTQLRKVGDNQYQANPAILQSRRPASGQLVQGSVERSSVDPIQAMLAVQNAANAVGASTRIMQIQDEISNRVINTFGRVSA